MAPAAPQDYPSAAPSAQHAKHGARRWTSSRTPGAGMFLQMDQAKSQARAAGVEITDLSIGTPDILPPQEALDALQVRCRARCLCAHCWCRRPLPVRPLLLLLLLSAGPLLQLLAASMQRLDAPCPGLPPARMSSSASGTAAPGRPIPGTLPTGLCHEARGDPPPSSPPPPTFTRLPRPPQASLSDPVTYKYCLKSGTMPLLEAAVAWYHRRCGAPEKKPVCSPRCRLRLRPLPARPLRCGLCDERRWRAPPGAQGCSWTCGARPCRWWAPRRAWRTCCWRWQTRGTGCS
jgi:hypothetical protein